MIAASGEGYPFPTNLDINSPLSGMAPPSQQDIMRTALAERWDQPRFDAAIDNHEAARDRPPSVEVATVDQRRLNNRRRTLAWRPPTGRRPRSLPSVARCSWVIIVRPRPRPGGSPRWRDHPPSRIGRPVLDRVDLDRLLAKQEARKIEIMYHRIPEEPAGSADIVDGRRRRIA